MQISTSSCLPSSPLYEFLSTGDTGTIPPPYMNLVPHFDYNIQAANIIPRFSLYDPSLPAWMVPDLNLPHIISSDLLVDTCVTRN